MQRQNIPEYVKKEIMFNQRYNCNSCKNILPIGHEFDHIIPWSISHNDDIENLQCLCNNCHASKTLKEGIRITKFKKLSKDQNLCWFCLQNLDAIHSHKCDKKLVDIILPTKHVQFNELDKLCAELSYVKLDSNKLKIQLCLYNNTITVNNFSVFIPPTNDICMNDIYNAIDLTTRSKKLSKVYDTIQIELLLNFEPSIDDIAKCQDFIAENILDFLPDRILKNEAELTIEFL